MGVCFMSKKKHKVTDSKRIDKEAEKQVNAEMTKIQTKLSKLQESVDCLFNFLIRKNVIDANEFKTFLTNEFQARFEKNLIQNSTLSGSVAMTYYNRESGEVI